MLPHSDQPGTKLNVIRPGYNEASLLERVDVWLEQANEPAALLDSNTATQHMIGNIDYNAKGQRTHIHYGNGVSTTYEYDPRTFRLARLLTDRGTAFANDWPQPPAPPRGGIQNLTYCYDPVGNITHIGDDAQQTIFFNGQRVEPSAEYEYDPMYRLITATGREHIGQHTSPQVDDDDSPRMNLPLPTDSAAMRNYTERYDYDPVGNILRMIHQAGANGSWTRRYDYEVASNRLRATSHPGDADGVFSANYMCDPHGNMTRMPHLPLMQWDYRDQLQATAKQVINNGTPAKTWYVYDAGGQRVRKVTEHKASVGETPTRMKEQIYLGGFEIYRQYENDGSTVELERETLHVVDDQQRIALVETKTMDVASPLTPLAPLIRYQFGNHLGSASLELDHQAQIISYEEYYPYGSTSYQAGRSAAEVSLKQYRYTGMERDEESGLNYHTARYYLPWLGRWLSADPIGIRGGWNLYNYANSNPVVLADMNGRSPDTRISVPEDYTHNYGNTQPAPKIRPEGEGLIGRFSRWFGGPVSQVFIRVALAKAPDGPEQIPTQTEAAEENKVNIKTKTAKQTKASPEGASPPKPKPLTPPDRRIATIKDYTFDRGNALPVKTIAAEPPPSGGSAGATPKLSSANIKLGASAVVSVFSLKSTLEQARALNMAFQGYAEEGPLQLSDELGNYHLRENCGHLGIVCRPYKEYVSGMPKELGFPKVEIEYWKYIILEKQVEAEWGYINFWGNFVPGTRGRYWENPL